MNSNPIIMIMKTLPVTPHPEGLVRTCFVPQWADAEGIGAGVDPREKHEAIGFFRNTGTDPLRVAIGLLTVSCLQRPIAVSKSCTMSYNCQHIFRQIILFVKIDPRHMNIQ